MTPEERAARRIGGSTIAKILKKSKWGTPLDAYLELTGERTEERTGEDIDRGNFLEPALRQWANKKTGLRFLEREQFELPEWDWATVRPDGLTQEITGSPFRANAMLEIKAPRRDDALQWGEEGSDEVPTDALLQTHWGLMVTNAKEGVVAALLGGELRIYRVKRDLDLEAKMLARAKEFVEQFVIPRVPPPAQFGDDRNILYLHPRNTKPHREWATLTPTEQQVVTEYVQTWEARKQLDDMEDQWKPTIKEMIADCDGLTLLNGRIDFKKNATAAPKWKQIAEQLMAGLPDEEVEALKQKYAAETPRVLTPRITKVKEPK